MYFFISLLCSILFAGLSAHTGKDLYTGIESMHYISRWRFQSLCRHYFDPYSDKLFDWATRQGGVSFDPKRVKLGDVIFVRNVDRFFNTIARRIKYPFVVITHGDFRDAFLPDYSKYIHSRKVIAWFGIHPNFKHPKFFSLPLGVYQKAEMYTDQKRINNLLTRLRSTVIKDKLLYINFDAKEIKPERVELLKYFSNKPFCTFSTQKPFADYLAEMARYKFVLSPPGLQIDCYRTWEALLVGSIPVVKSSYLNSLYSQLPVLVVNDLRDITEELLESKYKEITSRTYTIEQLFIEYWIYKIKQIRRHFLFYYRRALNQPDDDPGRDYLFKLAFTYEPDKQEL